MSTGFTFDQQSAVRIARAVQATERGLGIPTKRTRRAGLPGVGDGLVIVRLLEQIPAAQLYTSIATDFYSKLRDQFESDGVLDLGNIDPSTISQFLSDRVESWKIGEGLAVVCSFEETGSDVQGTRGQQINVKLRYGEVTKVYNPFPTFFDVTNNGGVFGNDAGSLGDGFCVCTEGDDGRLWLSSPDRAILVRTLGDIDDLQQTQAVHRDWIIKIHGQLVDSFGEGSGFPVLGVPY